MKYPDKVRNIKVTKGEKNPKNMSICLPRTRTRARAHEVYYTNPEKNKFVHILYRLKRNIVLEFGMLSIQVSPMLLLPPSRMNTNFLLHTVTHTPVAQAHVFTTRVLSKKCRKIPISGKGYMSSHALLIKRTEGRTRDKGTEKLY